MPLNRQDRKKLEELQVLDLSMKGHTYREISLKLGISIGKISSILSRITIAARTDIEERLFLTIIPLETRKRISKLDYCDKVLFSILETTTDDRVKCQVLSQINVNDSKRFEILTSEELLNRALSAQKATLIAKEISTITDRQQTDISKDNGNKDTSQQQEDTSDKADDTSQNESTSGLEAESSDEAKEGSQS